MTQTQGSPGSTHTSPSSQSAAAKSHSLTISSITGDYVYVVVQLTQDMQPVVYPHWKLPEDKFDLHVSDLTLAQFDKLAIELGKNVDLRKQKPTTPAQWYSLLQGSMLSLDDLLTVSNSTFGQGLWLKKRPQVIPHNIGLCLEVACLPHLRGGTPNRPSSNINASIDSVLRTIYHRRPDSSGAGGRRRIVFTSFSPEVCAALNWKQPNCGHPRNHSSITTFDTSLPDPVFFASLCGREPSVNPSPTVLAHTEARDERLSSLESAVRFSKANNLLGVIVEADMLVNNRPTASHRCLHVAHYLVPLIPLSPCSCNQSHASIKRSARNGKKLEPCRVRTGYTVFAGAVYVFFR